MKKLKFSLLVFPGSPITCPFNALKGLSGPVMCGVDLAFSRSDTVFIWGGQDVDPTKCFSYYIYMQ